MNAQTQPQVTETLEQKVARLEAELARKNAPKTDRTQIGNGLSCAVSKGGNVRKDGSISEGGAISIYGLNKQFPVTLYKAQVLRLIASIEGLKAFVEANDSKLTVKAPKAAK